MEEARSNERIVEELREAQRECVALRRECAGGSGEKESLRAELVAARRDATAATQSAYEARGCAHEASQRDDQRREVTAPQRFFGHRHTRDHLSIENSQRLERPQKTIAIIVRIVVP